MTKTWKNDYDWLPNDKLWLIKDKEEWQQLREEFDVLHENYLLSIEQSIASKFADTQQIKSGSIFTTIDNTIAALECLKKKEIESLRNRIIKNLESKKISSFKNFMIRFFTFGKVNRNRVVEKEIRDFNYWEYGVIENKRAKTIDKIKLKRKETLTEIENRYDKIKTENVSQEAEIKRQTDQIKDHEAKIKKIEASVETHKVLIADLEKDKQENNDVLNCYKEFVDKINEEKVDKFIGLYAKINGQQEEIDFYKTQLKEYQNRFICYEQNGAKLAMSDKEEFIMQSNDSGFESAYEANELTDNSFDKKNKDNINKQPTPVASLKASKSKTWLLSFSSK